MIDWLTHWMAVHCDPNAFTWHKLPGYLRYHVATATTKMLL
jgi:hypothetical protein